MSTSLRIVNWMAIAFFGFAVVALAITQPASSVLAVLNLVPFGLALIAIRGNSPKPAVWAGVVANALWALLYLGIAVVVLVGMGGSLVAIPLSLAVATPCVLNVFSLWRLLHAGA